MIGTYFPSNQLNDYFFNFFIGTALDQYHQTYEKIVLLGDLNA